MTDVIKWVRDDEVRMDALRIASSLKLHDWCLAAGFVRALIWDKLHGYEQVTELDDIDLIYFDKENCSEKIDREKECYLKQISDYPWSVKNQARMHIRNNDSPYSSSSDAMTYWVELQAAVGARLSHNGEIVVIAPFGLDVIFDGSIVMNNKRPKPDVFKKRIKDKRWLKKWPRLRVAL